VKAHLYQSVALIAVVSSMSPAWAQGNKPVEIIGGLESVTVTATKQETNLQKTPIAISVVSPELMADRHVTSLLDLGDGAIPGLRVATFEARQSALTIGIRGIVPLDANQPAREQGVGVYIDGVYDTPRRSCSAGSSIAVRHTSWNITARSNSVNRSRTSTLELVVPRSIRAT